MAEWKHCTEEGQPSGFNPPPPTPKRYNNAVPFLDPIRLFV